MFSHVNCRNSGSFVPSFIRPTCSRRRNDVRGNLRLRTKVAIHLKKEETCIIEMESFRAAVDISRNLHESSILKC